MIRCLSACGVGENIEPVAGQLTPLAKHGRCALFQFFSLKFVTNSERKRFSTWRAHIHQRSAWPRPSFSVPEESSLAVRGRTPAPRTLAGGLTVRTRARLLRLTSASRGSACFPHVDDSLLLRILSSSSKDQEQWMDDPRREAARYGGALAANRLRTLPVVATH